jgi:hypothetical protein
MIVKTSRNRGQMFRFLRLLTELQGMEVREKIRAALESARERQDRFAIELWDAALKGFSAPVPVYDMEEQRRKLLHNLDRNAGRYA